jgi:LPS O-antigen subunit length determinant protein (WzzB/FepE family)
MDGQVALDREAAMKQFIKTLDAVPSTRENWHTHSYEASSIAEVEAAALAS